MAKPSVKQLKKRLLCLIGGTSEREYNSQSDMASHFGHKLGMQSHKSRIVEAFESLEDEGVLELTRKGNQISGFKIKAPSGAPVPDDAKLGILASSATARRNAMFAKDTPFYLPNELCSPVVTSYLPGFGPEQCPVDIDSIDVAKPVETDRTVTNNESETMPKPSKIDTLRDLNLARKLLQDLAKADDGVLVDVSCSSFIMDELGCGATRASDLNVLLGRVVPPVRTSTSLGGGAWRHEVDLDRGEITAEQLRRARKRDKPAAAKAVIDTPEPVVVETSVEAIDDDLEIQPIDDGTSAPVVKDATVRLLEVIELLESKLAASTARNEALVADVAEQAQQIRELLKLGGESEELLAETRVRLTDAQAMLTQARAERDELREQSTSRSARMAEVLDRYGV